jgi:hypothetical protein
MFPRICSFTDDADEDVIARIDAGHRVLHSLLEMALAHTER